jgi:hypothetical protein
LYLEKESRVVEQNVLEFSVVTPTTGRVNETASDSGDQELVFDLKLYDAVQLLLASFEHAIEFLGLGNCTGEPVKHET